MTKGTEPFADVALGGLAAPVAAMLRELMGVRAVARLWAHDPALWKTEPEQVAEISERLGWLELPGAMAARLPELGAFADGVREAGFAHVVLCGMGGSSLWPEVLAQTFGAAPGYPRLIVLDSTVPAAVAAVDVRTEPGRTLYVISSKSGGTVEVMSFFAHFWAAVERAVGPAAGEHFVAITDPGTSLAELARSRGFRRTFLNPPDVGGRYSALSLFGLVPGVLIGLDLPALLAGAQAMARACAVEGERNPGLWLGAALGVAARAGRDKLTLAVSPAIDSLGLWLEQLLAESTGKEGRGILPVVGEPLGPPDAYGDDRLFVYLRLDGDANDDLDRDVAALRQAGQPVVTLRVPDRLALGAELVRWEVATAIASAVIGINPFDQPNVQESKDNTARLLKEAVDRRVLPEPPADLVADGLRFWGVCDGGEPHTEAPTTSLGRARVGDVSPGAALRAFVDQAGSGDYVAILAYLAETPAVDAALQVLRVAIRDRCRVATALGFGPRYLHSTGQYHKGGPPTGVFLQLTAETERDVPIPGQPYTFGVLAAAQALGDLEALRSRARPVLRINLGRDPVGGLRRVMDDE